MTAAELVLVGGFGRKPVRIKAGQLDRIGPEEHTAAAALLLPLLPATMEVFFKPKKVVPLKVHKPVLTLIECFPKL